MAKGRRSDFVPRGVPQQQPQNNMMQKIQQMQEDMRKVQEELETELVNVTARGRRDQCRHHRASARAEHQAGSQPGRSKRRGDARRYISGGRE